MVRLSQRIEKIHTSPIRRVAGLLDEARTRSDIISFGGGVPSIPPPPAFIKELNRLMSEEPLRSCGYTGTRGIPELRMAITADAKRYGKVDFDPAGEVIVTTGATESIFSSLMCVLEPGDEVIMTDPTYLGYREMVELAEGRATALPVTAEQDFQPSGEQLTEAVSKRTKAMILLSPDNPTGRIIDESFVKALIDLAQDYDFWIISDDIYKHIIYDGHHVWISRYPDAKERTITVCSFSKEAGIPGLRLGYTLGPKRVIDAIEKMQQYSTLAPMSVGQFALVQFLNQNMKEQYIKDSVTAYVKKRDFMGQQIRKQLLQAKTTTPAGAYYYFLDLRLYLTKRHQTEEQFAEKLLGDEGVAVTPGRFFGENGRGHVRMSFVTEPEERIERGIEKIARYLNQP